MKNNICDCSACDYQRIIDNENAGLIKQYIFWFVVVSVCMLLIFLPEISRADAVSMIEDNEGFRSVPYIDSEGHWTTGYGFSCAEHKKICWKPITQEAAEEYLRSLVLEIIPKAHKFAGSAWLTMGQARQDVLIDMFYQLGDGGMSKFKKFKRAVRFINWNHAAMEIIDSEYYHQTTNRAVRNANIMLTGKEQ